MKRTRLGTAVAPVVIALLVSSCAGAVVADPHTVETEPAWVEKADDGGHDRILLTEAAAERIAVKTAPVEKAADGFVVPSAAVFVDPEGAWWVYTNPEPLVYVRHAIGLVRQEGGRSFLSSGPAAGTPVVTVGVPELYGVEDEVGK